MSMCLSGRIARHGRGRCELEDFILPAERYSYQQLRTQRSNVCSILASLLESASCPSQWVALSSTGMCGRKPHYLVPHVLQGAAEERVAQPKRSHVASQPSFRDTTGTGPSFFFLEARLPRENIACLPSCLLQYPTFLFIYLCSESGFVDLSGPFLLRLNNFQLPVNPETMSGATRRE